MLQFYIYIIVELDVKIWDEKNCSIKYKKFTSNVNYRPFAIFNQTLYPF